MKQKKQVKIKKLKKVSIRNRKNEAKQVGKKIKKVSVRNRKNEAKKVGKNKNNKEVECKKQKSITRKGGKC